MIEEQLKALIEALNNNTAALNAVLAKSGDTTQAPATTAAPKKGKTKLEVVDVVSTSGQTETAVLEVEAPAAEEPEAEPTPDPEPEEQSPTFNRDEIIATITATVKENYRKAGSDIGAAKAKFEALRNEFKCVSVKELSDEKLVEFWPRLQAL